MVTRPSAASTFSASRSGVRLMPYSSASFSSSIQLPGLQFAAEDALTQQLGHLFIKRAGGQGDGSHRVIQRILSQDNILHQ
jgi:hypothetical protein